MQSRNYSDSSISLMPSSYVEVSSIEDERSPHILICIHGIRDNGAWCNVTATAKGNFLDSEIRIACVRYGRLSTLGFISRKKSKKILNDIKDQIDYIFGEFPESSISVLCHSNGTKIISELLKDNSFNFEWIFLCGSICHLDDIKYLRNINKYPVNDAGTKDWWPILAESIRPKIFQATGVCGFHKFPVIDRVFSYKHGDGVKQDHIENWILPTISSGKARKTPVTDVGFRKHVPTYLRRSFFIGVALTVILYTVSIF